jgi:hypothetical protein
MVFTRHIKVAGHSTKGWIIFATSLNEYFCIDSNDVIDKNNYNSDMYSWLVNNLHVFAPVKITSSSENSIFVKVIFTLEGREFIAKMLDLPEGYENKQKFVLLGDKE